MSNDQDPRSTSAENTSPDLAQTDLLNTSRPNPIKGWAIMAYSVISYVLFFATFLALIAFVGDLGALRSTVRPWLELDSTAAKVVLNLGLLTLFAVQHSVMARAPFKKWLTQYIPETMERSTYVLATVAVLAPILAFWQPLSANFYTFEGAGRVVMYCFFALGFVIVLISTFLINHFHLFGLQQGVQALKSGEAPPAHFVTPLFYKWVRHPMMTGMLLGIWAMTEVTAGRLLLNVAMTGYVLVGVYFEERSLTRELGDVYLTYKRHVPALIPGLRPAWPPKTEGFQGPSAAPEAA